MNLGLELNAGGPNATLQARFEVVSIVIAVAVPAAAQDQRFSREGV